MSKAKNDFANIGQVYGGMLSNLKKALVSEGKIGPKVAAGEIGDVKLLDGGPQEKSGFSRSRIDKRNKKPKSKENAYNIDNLSEDEESVKETKKIAKESINKFMRKKSIFDKLYENVMSGGPLGGGAPTGGDSMGSEMGETDELDALGIEGEDEMGEDEGADVTFTLDRETAQKLIDVLQGALGGEEDMGDEDFDMEGDMGDEDMDDDEGFDDEEDEEDLGHTNVNAKQPNMGKSNKVGNLKPQSGGASSKYTDKQGDDGDYGHALVNAKQPNMGKSNKVGNLKVNKSMFEQ
jgi:hypothetical protein